MLMLIVMYQLIALIELICSKESIKEEIMKWKRKMLRYWRRLSHDPEREARH
jgi:hypothetical protein